MATRGFGALVAPARRPWATRGPLKLATAVAVAAAFIAPLLTANAAQAAFLGERGVVFVSGTTSARGETDILAVTYSNGQAVLVANYTPHNHKVNLSPTVTAEGGPHILFVEKSSPSGPGDIYVMDRYPPGGGLPRPVQLTRDGDDEEQPAGSPSGARTPTAGTWATPRRSGP